MVEKLFDGRPPAKREVVLDPGCGRGEFIDGVVRWCDQHGVEPPSIVGVENDPHHWAPAHDRFLGRGFVKIRRRDFLKPDAGKYEFIIGNPPYVPITELTPEERESYRKAGYTTASGRMDLYMLFFGALLMNNQALQSGVALAFGTVAFILSLWALTAHSSDVTLLSAAFGASSLFFDILAVTQSKDSRGLQILNAITGGLDFVGFGMDAYTLLTAP
ncbi:MAG: hypothetical protein WB809_07015 [Thermoplasmata archaeon]